MSSFPSHWKLGRLKWDAELVAGGTPSTDVPDFWAEDEAPGTPFVAIADMSRRSRIETTAKRLTPAGMDSRTMPIGQPGQLLLAMYASVGEVAILGIAATWNQALLGITPKKEQVDAEFLRYVLLDRRGDLLKEVRSNTQANLSAGQVGDLWFQKPPLGEQEAIADYLDRETARIDTLIEEQQRLIDLLRERRQAVIESASAGGCSGASTWKTSGLLWAGEVPAHWDVAGIRKYATMKTGHTPSRNAPELWEACSIPWFTLADVWQLRAGRRTYLGETANQISELGLANSAAELLPAGTVVLSRTASVGFAGVMPHPMATSQDFWNWVPGDSLDARYLMWVFRAMNSEFQASMIGSTHKTIYQATAAALKIPVPPIDEQHEIVAYLDREVGRVDALIDETERFIELSKERRAALITAAVTGQIDVREAS